MQNEEPRQLCEGCRFWECWEKQTLGYYGFCRRHAPSTVSTSKGGEFEARWPMTHESEWCGEWRAPLVPPPNRTPSEDTVFVAR